jgi:hypothetical protein
MAKTQSPTGLEPIVAAYTELCQQIEDLKTKQAELEERRKRLETTLIGSFVQEGVQKVRVGRTTVFLKRMVYIYPRCIQGAVDTLKRLGLGEYVREQIINANSLAQHLDRTGMFPELEEYCELNETYRLCTRKN